MYMQKVVTSWLRHSFAVVAAATLLTACADGAPLSPTGQPAVVAQLGDGARAVELGSCSDLRAPEGSKLAFHTFATGVQIYRWNGSSWVFVAPEAALFADAAGSGPVGIHYAGPTWESASGSKVVGTLVTPCPVDPNSIAWLLLRAVSSQGPGIFDGVTHIQRVNTVGGKAPSFAGSFVGEETRVHYTAEYYFYRAQ